MKHLLLTVCALLALATPANAARLVNVGTGNIGTAATWGTVDSASYLNSETANTALTTSPVASSNFTPAASTLVQIGVKIASRAATPSGTFTIKLANATSAGNRECTATINVSDVPTASATIATAGTAGGGGGIEGGWVFVACTAAPNGTDNYNIALNTSVAAQINIFSSATTNWDRILVNNTTGTPAAGDQLWVAGLTASGSLTARTVTINTTALVNYGNVANTTVDPSISISNGGTLAFATTASTNFVFEHAGPMIIYNGGIFNQGTSGTHMPANSTATYTFNSTVEGDTCTYLRNGGTMNLFGDRGTRTANLVRTKGTNTLTGGVTTSITTVDTTGWLSGDQIEIAGTPITDGNALASYKDDQATLGTNSSGTTITLPAAVTNTHTPQTYSETKADNGITYLWNMRYDVVLLNRNVVLKGSGSTTNGCLSLQPNSIFNGDWVQFDNMAGGLQISYGANAFQGIGIDTGPSGSFSLTNFSVTNGHWGSMLFGGLNTAWGGVSGTPVTLQHGSFYNVGNVSSAQYYFCLAQTANKNNPFVKVDDIIVIKSCTTYYNSLPLKMYTLIGQFTNIVLTGSGGNGGSALSWGSAYDGSSVIGGVLTTNTWGNIELYANIATYVLLPNGPQGVSGTISDLRIWNEIGRMQTPPFVGGELVIDPFYIKNLFGSLYEPSYPTGHLTVRNGVIGIDGAGAVTNVITADAMHVNITFDNMNLCPSGAAGGITWVACSKTFSLINDMTGGGGYAVADSVVTLRNSVVPTTEYTWPTGQYNFWAPTTVITQDCTSCVVKHTAWLSAGMLTYDAAISHSSGYSVRMTPRVNTMTGYISAGSGSSSPGTTLTLTSGAPTQINPYGDILKSDSGSFIAGTTLTSGFSGTSYPVSISQLTGTPGSPVHFQSYWTPDGATPRLPSAPVGRGAKIVVRSGVIANVCVWLRPSINTDAAPPWGGSAVTYNGDNPRMINRANPYMGVQADTVLSFSNSPSFSAGTWVQACANLPSAPADGEFEVVVDADQTFTSNAGGSVNVAEWSCTGCGGPPSNNGQFWWNGAPADVVQPPVGRTTGFLLWRDLFPAANDNTPAWLKKTG